MEVVNEIYMGAAAPDSGTISADRLASTTGLADGNYKLRLTMASGVPTLSWVAE